MNRFARFNTLDSPSHSLPSMIVEVDLASVAMVCWTEFPGDYGVCLTLQGDPEPLSIKLDLRPEQTFTQALDELLNAWKLARQELVVL